MLLRIHLQGVRPYLVGDEIWHRPLADAIAREVDSLIYITGADLLPPDLSDASREQLRQRVSEEMTRALIGPGDRYRALDGVLYSLEPEGTEGDRPWLGRAFPSRLCTLARASRSEMRPARRREHPSRRR